MQQVNDHVTRSRSRRTMVLVLALALSAAGASRAQEVGPRTLTVYTERVPTGFINWGEGFAEVDVEATYDTVRHGASHAKIRAIEDGEKKADDALYRLIRGVNVHGDKRLAGDADMEAALKKAIPKSRKMDIGKIANVTMNVRFTVPFPGKKSVLGVVHPLAVKSAAPECILADATGGDHTSVVFDASKTSLQASLFPRVVSEGGDVIFDAGAVDGKTLNRGMAANYVVRTEDTGDKKSGLPKDLARKLGDNPLVIEVGKIGGEFLADIVLRDEQVEKLRQARVGDLFAAGQVFIIQTKSVDVSQ